MDFKNDFEESCYNTCRTFLSNEKITIEHNYTIKTEKEIVSFTGKPKKEVDVITLDIPNNIKLLISCKDFKRNAPPEAIQEWGNVIKVLNEQSTVSSYFGLVVSSKGFSEGCEVWAKTNNLGLIPPYRGDKNNFTKKQVLKMLQRVIHVFLRSIERQRPEALIGDGNFYWMCYKTTADIDSE